MNASLLRALRIVERADSSPVRRLLFARLAERSTAVRLARWATHGPLRGSRPAAWLVGAYGAATALRCLDPPPAGRLWALALYGNERREVAAIARALGGGKLVLGRPRASALPRALALALRAASSGAAGRYLRSVRRFARSRDFLVSCRLASTLACGMAGRTVLSGRAVIGLLVASDYNAEAVGLCSAARCAGVPTLFVSHSHTHASSPPLDFSLAILEGAAALEAYAAKGPVRARVAFKGIEGETREIRAWPPQGRAPVVGLFLPKEVAWPALAALVADIRRSLRPQRLLVRWHPSMVERPRLERALDDLRGVECSPPGTPLPEDAGGCDLVLADENSGVFLGVLKAGVPALPVRGLAVFPPEARDPFGLAADGIVPEAVASLSELRPGALARFYTGDWCRRFRRYDGAYGRPRAEVEREIADAIIAVTGPLAAG